MDDGDPRRDKIQDFLQDLGPVALDSSAVLSGWVLVLEWVDESGNKWLSKGHSDSLPGWAANGLHHEALYGNWGDEDRLGRPE